MKAWKIIAALVAVLVIGLVVFIATFDIGQYKGLIQDQAKAATGREVTIGDIRMGLSLTPTVILTDVTLANAAWGSRPIMATVKKVEATAELLPLLSGKVNIGKIDAEGVDALLETNKQGVGNWEFSTQEKDVAPTGDAQQSSALNIGAIDGADLKITYKDGRSGSQIDAALKSITAKLTGAVQDLNVTSLTMNDATVSQKADANTLQASIGKVDMQASGSMKDFAFKTVEVSDVKIAGNGESPVNAEIVKLTLAGDGALDMQAKYNGGDVRAKGTLAAVTALKSGKKAVPMKLSLEGLGLKGDVDLTVDADRTPIFVKGTVTIPEIDMAAFSAKPGAGAAPAAKGGGNAPLFPSDPLPWDVLNSVDADVKVDIATLKLASGPPLTNVSLPVKIDKGQLAMNGASVDMAGGKIDANVDANAGARSVALKGGAKGLTAEALAKAYGKDIVAGGPLSITLDVRGAGASPQAIAASLNGSFLADMGESRISNAAMNLGGAQALLSIVTTSNPLAKQEPYTVAKCVVANFQIANGVASTQNGLAFITDKVQGTGTGKVDLGQNRIDLIVKPTVSGGIGSQLGKLVSTVKVTGTIDSPNYGVDAASTATAVAGLAAGIATGGAAGGLLGLNGGGSTSGGGGLFGALGGVLGGKPQQQQQAAAKAPADICAAARAKR